ncbi:MAG: malectin domain-containing carbohydrate-binding protein, partial [Deltaproteobacteria bacterium]|nr:malectin domain-containing carbohydrate-binding protein [Deltaproteobacteria bacterium]
VKAINCGGDEITIGAVTYEKDNSFTSGTPYSNVHPIAGNPLDQELYYTERWGTFYYTIDGLTEGNRYLVTLKLAEIYPYAYQGARIFTVVIDGKRVIMDLDLFVWAGGKYKAFDAKIPVQAKGTSMKIAFFGEECCVNRAPKIEDNLPADLYSLNRQHQPRYVPAKCRTADAKVNAILVEDFEFNPQPFFAINSGSTESAESQGIIYGADNYFVLGQTYSTSEPISGTSDGKGKVYKTERYGDFSYAIPTGNGKFNVLLKFAEIYEYIYQGARIIAVDIEGKRVITGLDLDAQFGLYQAYDFFVPFPIEVNDGVLNIDFFTEECCLTEQCRHHRHHPKADQCESGHSKVSAILVYTQTDLQ